MAAVLTAGLSAYAETAGEYAYNLVDGKAVITAYAGFAEELTIPDQLDGHPVAGIGYRAFRNRTELTGVTIPESVTVIGSFAFEGCGRLAAVSLPAGLTSINDWAFHGCVELADITLPASLFFTYIGNGAFKDCRKLESVALAEGARTLGDYAFMGCTGLTSASFPWSVDAFGEGVFEDCPNLTLTVPEGSHAFDYARANGIPFKPE